MNDPSFLDKLTAFLPQILWSVIAVMGGIAKHLNGVIMRGEKWRIGVLLSKGFISGFTGWMLASLASTLTSSPTWIQIAAGIGGWFGAESIEFIIIFMKDKFDFIKVPPKE